MSFDLDQTEKIRTLRLATALASKGQDDIDLIMSSHPLLIATWRDDLAKWLNRANRESELLENAFRKLQSFVPTPVPKHAPEKVIRLAA